MMDQLLNYSKLRLIKQFEEIESTECGWGLVKEVGGGQRAGFCFGSLD